MKPPIGIAKLSSVEFLACWIPTSSSVASALGDKRMEITCYPITAEHLDGDVGLRALREAIATELSEERGGPLFLAEAQRTSIETMLVAVAANQAHLLGAFGDNAPAPHHRPAGGRGGPGMVDPGQRIGVALA